MKPEYWDKAKRALARRDPVLAKIIRAHPRVHLVPFAAPDALLVELFTNEGIGTLVVPSVAALHPAGHGGAASSAPSTELVGRE